MFVCLYVRMWWEGVWPNPEPRPSCQGRHKLGKPEMGAGFLSEPLPWAAFAIKAQIQRQLLDNMDNTFWALQDTFEILGNANDLTLQFTYDLVEQASQRSYWDGFNHLWPWLISIELLIDKYKYKYKYKYINSVKQGRGQQVRFLAGWLPQPPHMCLCQYGLQHVPVPTSHKAIQTYTRNVSSWSKNTNNLHICQQGQQSKKA